MKSYVSLVPISARVHKRQHRMVLVCILLAVFLVTAIFSMADMGIRMQRIRAYHDHGSWHIAIKALPEAAEAEIAARRDVARTAWQDVLNSKLDKDYFAAGKKAMVCGISGEFGKMHGGFPEDAGPLTKKEAILSANAQNVMEIAPGDSVTLSTPAGEVSFTVSGFYDDSENLMVHDAVGLFVNLEAFREILGANGEAGEPSCYVQFADGANVRRAIGDIQSRYALPQEGIEENQMILLLSGMSADSVVLGYYGVAAALFVLILAAGVLMISGSMSASVAQRSQFFGMLRCIGASQKQVMRIVKLEALHWCAQGLPLGLGLGVAVTWGLCWILRNVVGGEFADIPVLGISGVGLVCGSVVGVLTVLLAARAPAKRAAKVSPVAAVAGNTGDGQRACPGVPASFGKIETALGIHHALSEKKNLLLITLSFALSIVLFLCFSAVLDVIALILPAVQPSAPDVSIYQQGYSGSVSSALAAQIREKPNVERVFGRMYRGKVPVVSSKGVETVDLISYEQYQFQWAEEVVLKGDLTRVSGGSCVMTDYFEGNPLEMGDTLLVGGHKVEIAAVLASTPFASDDTPLIICSEQTFQELMGEEEYAIVDVQLTEGAGREDVEAIRALVDEQFVFSDRWELNRDDVRLYWAFRVFGYGFLAMIALIAMVNILNSVGMRVYARLRQYGILRAVGMCEKQLVRMIAAEAVTDCIFAAAAGLGLGIPLHRWCYGLLVTAHYGISWQVPVRPLCVIMLLMAGAAAAAVYFPSRRIRRMGILDAINGQEYL